MHIYRGHEGSSEQEDGPEMLKRYIIRGWPHTKDQIEPGVEGIGLSGTN